MEYRQFDPEASSLNRAMADGHRKRCGHALQGYYESLGDTEFGLLDSLVRTCCESKK